MNICEAWGRGVILIANREAKKMVRWSISMIADYVVWCHVVALECVCLCVFLRRRIFSLVLASFVAYSGLERKHFAVNYLPSPRLWTDRRFAVQQERNEKSPKWWKSQSTLTCGFCSAMNPLVLLQLPRKTNKIKILSTPTLTDVYFPCGFCTLTFCFFLSNWDRENFIQKSFPQMDFCVERRNGWAQRKNFSDEATQWKKKVLTIALLINFSWNCCQI